MPAIRITKRIIDPITFVERVGVEFIPRLEDSVLDDQLASSISYLAPKDLVIPPPPPPPPAASPDRYRPPTPPKHRTHGDKDSNNLRPTSSNSPRARRGKVPSQGSGAMFSPKGGKRKSLSASLASLAQIGEEDEMNEASLSDLSGLQTSLHKTEEKLKAKAPLVKSVRFADEVELNEISRLRNSMLFAMFYDSEDLANFRYEAFMEEAGLDMAEFD